MRENWSGIGDMTSRRENGLMESERERDRDRLERYRGTDEAN